MVATPFDALETAANAAVLAHLSNAVAQFGDTSVAVIFDRPNANAFGGLVEASQPQLHGPSASLSSLRHGDGIVIKRTGQSDQSFTVAATEPDGTGITRIVLEVV